MTWTWTPMTDGAAGASTMVTPNTVLITSRGFVCNATAADSTWLAPPAVSVATTVRITLPALTVTASTHAGKRHCSSWRKLDSTEFAFALYSSTVPPTVSTKVTSFAITISLIAPGGNGGGGGDGGITSAHVNEPGQAARVLQTASWHAVDAVACWALLQTAQEEGACPDWMTPPAA